MSAADPAFLVDSSLTVWTLVSSASNGFRVSKAGITDTTTSNVVLLLYYRSIIYNQNSSGTWASYNGVSWVSLSADPRITNPSIGPVAAGTIVADFTSLTTDKVARELFGVSTASMVDNNFVLCNNLSFQTASKAFDPPLLRFNCNAGGSGGNTTLNSFPNGPAGGINAAVYAPLINNLNRIVNLSTTKIVMCFGGGDTGLGPTNGWTVAEFASAFSQTIQLFRNTAGSDGRPIDPIYWEIGNEVESFLTNAAYATYFNACADAAHAIDTKYILCGPVAFNSGSEVTALITAAGSGRLGLPDNHAYLYKPGVDGTPSDLQVAQAAIATTGTTPATLAASINTSVAGTYAANVPYFVGQYNVGGGSSSSFNGLFGPNDATGRDQNLIGALFATSWLFKLQVAANPTVWAGYWEYGTSTYGLFTGTFSKTPPGAILSALSHNAAGTIVTVTNGTGLEAWATVSGPTFCMILVNPTTGALTQSAGLSHWSLNTAGTANINRFEVSQANLAGIETAVSVTAGVLSVTVPGQSIVLLYP